MKRIRIRLFNFDADRDPDPAFHFDADPDPTFHFDSDLTFHGNQFVQYRTNTVPTPDKKAPQKWQFKQEKNNLTYILKARKKRISQLSPSQRLQFKCKVGPISCIFQFFLCFLLLKISKCEIINQLCFQIAAVLI